MAKIHTHYDNLKVSRMAPREVIRAAYKALSQKYHPDKNPGDEKAARIMAILNSAYLTLSDSQRRKEHDEWIAAEEWEVEWLESTRQEEGKDGTRSDGQHGAAQGGGDGRHKADPSRNPKWWLLLLVCFFIGWLGGLLTQPGLLPQAVSDSLVPLLAVDAKREPVGAARAEPKPPPAGESWGDAKPQRAETGNDGRRETRAVLLSQVRLGRGGQDCSPETARPTLAPSGEPWPLRSGYVAGYVLGNTGGDSEIVVDNSGNPSDAFVKLLDVEKSQTVRHLLVLAHEKFKVEQLSAGNYEVRSQNLGMGPPGAAPCPADATPEK